MWLSIDRLENASSGHPIGRDSSPCRHAGSSGLGIGPAIAEDYAKQNLDQWALGFVLQGRLPAGKKLGYVLEGVVMKRLFPEPLSASFVGIFGSARPLRTLTQCSLEIVLGISNPILSPSAQNGGPAGMAGSKE